MATGHAVHFVEMANLAQFGLGTRGREARVRALLEDLVQEHMGFRPEFRLALAVWFRKTPNADDQYLLELLTGPPIEGVAQDRLSLLWKSGGEGPPYANVHATSIEYFLKLSTAYPDQTAVYQDSYEVLYFDKKLLVPQLLDMFQIVTEPPGLMKGWYVSAREYAESKSIQGLLSRHGHTRPEVGLVKTGESGDFKYCHGVLHVEFTQRWLPLSPEGIQAYTYYNDRLAGSSGYFLFEGGSLYEILKFEVKTAPEYAGTLLGTTPDDRYPEVYLRTVQPPAQSAA
jgi:hypothetical protein